MNADELHRILNQIPHRPEGFGEWAHFYSDKHPDLWQFENKRDEELFGSASLWVVKYPIDEVPQTLLDANELRLDDLRCICEYAERIGLAIDLYFLRSSQS